VLKENLERAISLTGYIIKLTFLMARPVWPEGGAFICIAQVGVLCLQYEEV
jgi:hypothetical protein